MSEREQLSIHPRNWRVGSTYLFEERRKSNTCKPRSRKPLERALAGIARHVDNHPRDEEARKRLSNLKTRLAAL